MLSHGITVRSATSHGNASLPARTPDNSFARKDSQREGEPRENRRIETKAAAGCEREAKATRNSEEPEVPDP